MHIFFGPYELSMTNYSMMQSVIQPAHPQLLLNPFIRLKHRTPNTLSYFS